MNKTKHLNRNVMLINLEKLARETAEDAKTNKHTRLHAKEGTQLILEVDEQDLIELMKRLYSEFEGVEGESPDEVINFWCARADEGLMFTVAKEVYGE